MTIGGLKKRLRIATTSGTTNTDKPVSPSHFQILISLHNPSRIQVLFSPFSFASENQPQIPQEVCAFNPTPT